MSRPPRTARQLRIDRERKRLLSSLGFKGALSPSCYLRHKGSSNAWNKLNRYKMNAASRRYKAKVRAKYGVCGDHQTYLFAAGRLLGKLAYWRKRQDDARKKLLRVQNLSRDSYGGRQTLLCAFKLGAYSPEIRRSLPLS